MGLKKWLSDFFNSEEPKTKKIEPKTRRQVEDVRTGDSIQIEWYMISGGIGYLKCLSNDPVTRKILLEATWNNSEEMGEASQKVIFDYNGKELKNFHLLNSFKTKVEVLDESDIASLQKRMNDALEKEEYETARKIQNKIDKLLRP